MLFVLPLPAGAPDGDWKLLLKKSDFFMEISGVGF
jgi:hypothetical protein